MINGRKRAYVPVAYAKKKDLGLEQYWEGDREGFRDEPCKVLTVATAKRQIEAIPALKTASVTSNKKNKDNNASVKVGDFLLGIAKKSEEQGYLSMSDLKAIAQVTAQIGPEVGSPVFKSIVNKLVQGGFIAYARGNKAGEDEPCDIDLSGFSLEG